ncbi:M16 family metallopeptidase [Sinomicrobium sp.]
MKYLKRLSGYTLVYVLLLSMNSYAVFGSTLKDSLALDKSIRTGVLPNGFTYYLKPTLDTDKISLRFYVKVGEYNERLLQTQYAHLLEHMGYAEGYVQYFYSKNGDAFKKSGNTTYAMTADLYTPYWSSVQAEDTTSLKDCLQWFANIANMELKESVVLREARCVRQEFVYKQTPGVGLNSYFDEHIREATIFFDKEGESPYANWLSTYEMGGISVPSVREFYHRWYRPDRMGLVITGNIQDMDNLEQQISALYSKIPKAKVKHEDGFDLRQFYLSVPPRFKTVERMELGRFSDWNKSHSKITLSFRVKKFHKALNTKEKWLNEQLYKTMYSMIDQRLREKGVPSWSIGGVIEGRELPERRYPYYQMQPIENKPGSERENLQRVVSILQQLRKEGFTQKEWDKRKQLMLNQITSKGTSIRKYWEKELENHFVYGELLPAHKKALTKQWIESLRLKDINRYLQDNFSVMPDDIYITASAGHPALSFTEKQVRGWIKEAMEQPIEIEKAIDIASLIPVGEKKSPLMSAKEVEGLKVVTYQKIGTNPDTGFEILELENGVKLLLDRQEPSSTGAESITVSGSSPRGTSCFPKEAYYAAISAPKIVQLSGVGDFDRKAIRDKLGKEFPLNTEPVQLQIKYDTSTVSTRATLEDLEQYLQLIYLYFTSPKEDPIAFAQWQDQIRQRYFGKRGNVGGSPKTDIKNAIAAFLNVQALRTSSSQISTDQFYQSQNVTYEKAMGYYKAIFGNASDFTFVVKGRYKKEQVLPLLQKYLGNLSTTSQVVCSTVNTFDKKGIELPPGPVYHTFYADKMKTTYKLYFTPYVLSYVFPIPEDNWKDRVIMNIIHIYLYRKVDKELRFIVGTGTYAESVNGQYLKADALYNLAIFVDALDDELDWIRSECKTMITDIKEHGIDMHNKESILEDPLFLGRYTSTPELKEKVMQYARSLTAEDIKKVAVKYFKKSHQYEFVFRESSKEVVTP